MPSQNDCRCEKKVCGCTTPGPCRCGEQCTCQKSCSCGNGCNCTAVK